MTRVAASAQLSQPVRFLVPFQPCMAGGPPNLDLALGDVLGSFTAGPSASGGFHAGRWPWGKHGGAIGLQVSYRSEVVEYDVDVLGQVCSRGPDGVEGAAYGSSHLGVVHLGPKAKGEVVREEKTAGLLSVVSAAGSAV